MCIPLSIFIIDKTHIIIVVIRINTIIIIVIVLLLLLLLSLVLSLSLVFREFTKGGLVKGGGLAIYAFPLCNCNTKHA